jgi:hypothetical protein
MCIGPEGVRGCVRPDATGVPGAGGPTLGVRLIHDDLVVVVRVAVESFRVRVGAVVDVCSQAILHLAQLELLDLDVG